MGINGHLERSELGEFLRLRRSLISPASVGFPVGARRRTPGLRREEVALLAGVSVSWYTWIEQGRPVNASVDVLDALGRVLGLNEAERDHLVELAGHPAGGSVRRTGSATDTDLPEWAQRLLDAMVPAPAYLLGPTWAYLAWNAAQARLFPAIASLQPGDRNLVWVMFALDDTRQLVVDWEAEARRVLSQFRADITPWRDDPTVRALVARLRTASPEFDAWWDLHDVAAFETRIRTFRHPIDGIQTYEYQQLIPAGRPDLRFVIQLPITARAT